MNRLFLCLFVPATHVPTLELVQDHLPTEGVRFTKAHDFHLTFKFLGEVDFVKRVQVQLALKELHREITFTPQDLQVQFSDVGTFSLDDEPTVVWVGVKLSPKLYEFHYEMEGVLERFGFRKDSHRFKPHITLARVRDLTYPALKPTQAALSRLGVKRQSFQAVEMALVNSQMEMSSSPQYDTLETFPFGVS